MISIIKTAIITIIISFISGLLLEHYKNLATKILCNIGDSISLVIKNRNVYAYILTVRNLSNKTIHDITLNIQDYKKNLNFGDAEITKGLKFDSSIKDNILDVYIPFLSKDDEFKVTLYVDYEDGEYNKPIVTIRSPENFKEVDSEQATGVLASVFNVPKNITKLFSKDMKDNKKIKANRKEDLTTIINTSSDDTKMINKSDRKMFNRNKNKKLAIGAIAIALIISSGILGRFYFQKVSAHTPTSDTKTDVQDQSSDVTKSAGAQDKNKDKKAPTYGKTKNSTSNQSTDEATKNVPSNQSTDGTNQNLDEKTQTDKETENANTKPAADKPAEKSSTNKTNESTDIKSSNGTAKNADAKPSTDEATKNVPSKPSTDETKNTNTSTAGTTGNTSN